MDFDVETFVAHTLRGTGHDASEDGTGRGVPLIPVVSSGRGWWDESEVGATLRAQDSVTKQDTLAIAYQCQGSNVGEMGTLRKGSGSVTGGVPFVAVDLQNGRIGGDVSGTLDTTRPGRGGGQAVVSLQDVRPRDKAQNGRGWSDDGVGYTVDAANTQGVALPTMGVRRLTPREMERLQGFPDDYTAIPWRGKPASECPDGPRAKALGNSMAVPVMRWIGERIAIVEKS